MNREFQEIIRILLRYLGGSLITSGWISVEAGSVLTDPAMLTALSGILVTAISEIWFVIAKYRN